MSGPTWASAALDALLERVDATVGQVGDRFPLYADISTGTWTTTRRGSWTGGFWSGLLRLRAAASGASVHEHEAQAVWRALQQWRHRDTSCRGLIFWYGSLGQTSAGTGDDLAVAARALVDAFDPDLGLVPWGSAFGHARAMACVDGTAGVVPLLAWSGRHARVPHAQAVGQQHLRRHLQLCREGEAVRPKARSDDGGRSWSACTTPGAGWSRATAWLLLACVDGAVWWGNAFRKPAAELAEQWVLRHGLAVPAADAAHPYGPVDTSAGCVVAVAWLKLAELVEDNGWRRAASELLQETVKEHLVTEGPAPGALVRGCYDLAGEVGSEHELVWGDFFCALGLGMLTGLVPTSAV